MTENLQRPNSIALGVRKWQSGNGIYRHSDWWLWEMLTTRRPTSIKQRDDRERSPPYLRNSWVIFDWTKLLTFVGGNGQLDGTKHKSKPHQPANQKPWQKLSAVFLKLFQLSPPWYMFCFFFWNRPPDMGLKHFWRTYFFTYITYGFKRYVKSKICHKKIFFDISCVI